MPLQPWTHQLSCLFNLHGAGLGCMFVSFEYQVRRPHLCRQHNVSAQLARRCGPGSSFFIFLPGCVYESEGSYQDMNLPLSLSLSLFISCHPAALFILIHTRVSRPPRWASTLHSTHVMNHLCRPRPSHAMLLPSAPDRTSATWLRGADRTSATITLDGHQTKVQYPIAETRRARLSTFGISTQCQLSTHVNTSIATGGRVGGREGGR